MHIDIKLHVQMTQNFVKLLSLNFFGGVKHSKAYTLSQNG